MGRGSDQFAHGTSLSSPPLSSHTHTWQVAGREGCQPGSFRRLQESEHVEAQGKSSSSLPPLVDTGSPLQLATKSTANSYYRRQPWEESPNKHPVCSRRCLLLSKKLSVMQVALGFIGSSLGGSSFSRGRQGTPKTPHAAQDRRVVS